MTATNFKTERPKPGESNRRKKEVRWEVGQRSQGRCEAQVSDECRDFSRLTGRPQTASEVHHRKMRSQGGPDTVANCATLCHDCHAWTHAHPAVAYRLGLLIRGSDPDPSECYVRSAV